MTRIGISGSYGGLNLGDEAILSSAIAEIRAALPEVEIIVFSRNAEHTRRHQAADRVLAPRTALREAMIAEIDRLDLLLLGGGGILYDSEARTYLREVALAQERGIPTFAFAIGIGPLRDRDERNAVRDGLNRMAGITVREIGAKRLAEEIGVERPVTVTADPALLLTPAPFDAAMLAREGIPAGRRLVGMSVRERGRAAPDLAGAAYHRLLADTADYVVHRYDAEIVFVPMERSDVNEAHQVIAGMAAARRAHVLKGDYGPRRTLGFMRHLEMAIGMRLHFLIFAALTGIPLVALPYAPKVADLLEALGLPERTAVHETHAGVLLAELDRLWDEQRAHRAALRERVERLQAAAARTVPLALAAIGRHGAIAAPRAARL